MTSQLLVYCRYPAFICISVCLFETFATARFPQSNEAVGNSENANNIEPSPKNALPLDSADPSPDDNDVQSDAERIGELQGSLEQDQKQLLSLEQEMENPNSEYAISECEFLALKEELEAATEKLEAATKNGEADAILHLEQEIGSLYRKRKLAEDRFDLAIEDRKTLREQRTTLRRKIENDKSALAAITGEDERDPSDRSPSGEKSNENGRSADSSHREDDSSKNEHRQPSYDRQNRDDPSEHNSEKNPVTLIEQVERPTADEEEQNAELTKAVDEAEEKGKEADQAQEETRSIAARLADIQKLVAQEQKELDLARKKVELASATQLTLSQELTRRIAEQADAAELADLRTSIGNASSRLIQARSEVSEISERLNDHRAEQSSLQSEHIVALHEANEKRKDADAAEDRIAAIRNPFTLRNISQWLLDHGPRILAIIVGMFLLNRLASFFATRSVHLVTTGSGRGSKMERENRAKTLVGVFQNASAVGIFITGIMMFLDEVGANITVLMGGVAVVGLAVAFGAQNLIKDYFYGFVMLLENQYMLNDTVRVGGVSGQVERITLRMTVLRDSNGVVHFIPNGTINSVSNETHGWSRAVCEIAIGYQESLDRITDILHSISKELQADPVFGKLLLEPPSDPAIESLGESAVNLKLSVKTLPNKHGTVKQEWLKRIKNRFAELGVQHPFPQRTVHVQTEDANQDRLKNGTNRPGNYRQAG